MTIIDNGEIVCMSILKCHWMVIVLNRATKAWYFAWCCLMVWFGVCRVSIRYSRLSLWQSPLVIVACLLQGVADVLQGFLPIYPAGFGEANQDSGAGYPYWWLHGPINPKYILWGCSPVILQAAQSWWCCSTEGNQGLPEYGEVCCYRLGSGSYPWNAAWQMALRCFAKCHCRAHQWDTRGLQEAIWHHIEKSPRQVPNHHQLGPYKPGTFAGSAYCSVLMAVFL